MRRHIEEILREVRIADLDLDPVVTVALATPLREVYELLAEHLGGAVVVVAEERVAGIFTERDILYLTALEDPDPETPIGDLMTPRPICLAADQRLAEAIAVMTQGGYRHVPLTDEERRPSGLLSSRDIVKYLAEHFPEAVLNLPPRLDQGLSRPEGG